MDSLVLIPMKLRLSSKYFISTNFFRNHVVNAFDIFQQLAKMHSLCIAMKRQQPDLFNTKVRPFLQAVNLIPECDGTRQIEANQPKFTVQNTALKSLIGLYFHFVNI